MVFAIEPMITAGGWERARRRRRLGHYTDDGTLAAHCEHTVAITAAGRAC